MITVHLTDASHAHIQAVLEDQIELCESLNIDEPEEAELKTKKISEK
jgi:hypothetical protein